MRNFIVFLVAALVFAPFITPVFAQNDGFREARSASHIRENIESPYGKTIFDWQAGGAPLPDGFGAKLPAGFAAKEVIRLLLPQADASLATLVGVKRWPYGENVYIAFACIAPSPEARESALQSNSGKPVCTPDARENYLMAVGVLRQEGDGRIALASTVISWPDTEKSPLGATWSHSNLSGPGGINTCEEEGCAKAEEDDFLYPTSIYRFDFAKYAIRDGVIAFGIRSGMQDGYAGGGAHFQILTLFAVIDGKLRVVFSEPMYYLMNIAGDWHKDGTRSHDVFEGENTVSISPAVKDGYHSLVVKSRESRWRKSFSWDKNSLHYEVDE